MVRCFVYDTKIALSGWFVSSIISKEHFFLPLKVRTFAKGLIPPHFTRLRISARKDSVAGSKNGPYHPPQFPILIRRYGY